MRSILGDLRTFSEFLASKVRANVVLSPEEALDEWRMLHPDSSQAEEDVTAMEEALQDRANGDRGRPFEDVLADLRRTHGLAEES